MSAPSSASRSHQRDVAGLAPLVGPLVAGAALDHVPVAGRGPPDGEVGPPVVVVVAGRRDVAVLAPPRAAGRAGDAVLDVPDAVARPPDREVGPRVVVV